MSTEIEPRRRWLRYSLASFLFVSLCIGGLFAGYQSGFRHGYNNGQALRYDQTQVTQSFDTSFLIWPDLPESDRVAGINNLKDLIQSSVSTDIWNDGRGNDICADRIYHSNLVVTAPGEAQNQIRTLLAQLEELGARGGAQQLMPALQSVASVGKSQGKSQDSLIPIASPKNSQLGRVWFDKYFDLTADEITKQWGEPRFRGKCTDAGFPAWSLDQRIVTWAHGGGISYLAARTLDDGQLHIAVGWRQNS
jgi:hypothetical protein